MNHSIECNCILSGKSKCRNLINFTHNDVFITLHRPFACLIIFSQLTITIFKQAADEHLLCVANDQTCKGCKSKLTLRW